MTELTHSVRSSADDLLTLTGNPITEVPAVLLLTLLASTISSAGVFVPAPASWFIPVAVAAAFVWLHVSARRRGWPLFGSIRLARPSLRPTSALAAAALMLLLGWGVSGLLQRWVGLSRSPLAPSGEGPLHRLAETPEGFVTVALYAVLVAPIVEEFTFRGWIQRPLERWWGAAPAILTTALLFAVAHMWYGRLPFMLIPFLLGIAWGAAVVVSGSIWTSVVLHAFWNAVMMVMVLAEPSREKLWPIYQSWGAAACIIAVLAAIGGFVWLAGRELAWRDADASG